MTDRFDLKDRFLRSSKWRAAVATQIAGDASNRKYDRLQDAQSGRTAILMDAPPEKGEDVRPFIRIAAHLRDLGLSAPEILEADETHGFLVLEDLGDALFSKSIPQRPELESVLYASATDVLLHMHTAPLPDLASYDPDLMAELSTLALTKYANAFSPVSADVVAEFRSHFADQLRTATGNELVMILRDYHADNLLWLPDRKGVARVGLLDFQDAMAGHRAYDLVSLLQDVRRDVTEETEREMIARYVAKSRIDRDAFVQAYYLLGAQRALRILGVFARLGSEYGRPHYVDMIPKVWQILQVNLNQPALQPVAETLRALLPEPEAGLLAKLKS